MCGICGFAGFRDDALLARMCAALAHRGPDDEGMIAHERVSLGHRRLAIIDLETGRQPIHNEDSSVFIVFNGEIYNYAELMSGLIARGHTFGSKSDTESIVHLYEDLGIECLSRLRGNFALALWDKNRETLFLARDRLGIRPLYYARLGNSLLFASEAKSILLSPGVSREINFHALDDYFTYLYVPAPKTIFSGISKLEPGQYLEWKNGNVRLETYWKLAVRQGRVPSLKDPSPAACREFLLPLMEETVKLHTVSDVPIGAFVSGGLDSSTVLSLLAGHSSSPVRTFTIGFEDGADFYDEREPARRIAELFGADHTEIVVKPDCAGLLPLAVSVFDEPFGNPTAILTYILARELKRHVKVALSGEGGDETFAGYPRYLGALLSRYYRRVPFPLRALLARTAALIPEDTAGRHAPRRLREFLTGNTLPPEEMYTLWVSYFDPHMRDRLYTPALKRSIGTYRAESFLLDLFAQVPDLDFLDRVNYVDLRSFLPCNEFEFDDKMTMAHGFEARAPFVDHVLIETMCEIPMAWKISRLKYKPLLRRAMEGILPPDILSRPKVGFNPPMGVWLKRDLKSLVASRLSREKLVKTGFFNYDYVRELLALHDSGRRDLSLHVWALLVFMEWYEQYVA
ncbi:MAG: asparagine synthase (glutamine-hydrolyzing) [bacterium]